VLDSRLISYSDATFLTGNCCENIQQVSEQHLLDLDLGVGQFNGASYPLTDQESLYVGDDSVEIGGTVARTGYSALAGRRKFLTPSIDIDYFPASAGNRLDFQAHQVNAKLRPILEKLADMVQGHFIWESKPYMEFEDGEGWYRSEIFIPFEYAIRHASDFESWKQHLKGILSQAAATVEQMESA